MPVEDCRVRVSTRGDWAQWITYPVRSPEVTSKMIDIGVAEFLKYRGVRTVEVVVQGANSSRMMVWRGSEEVTIT